jgi:hypothetical protein
MKIINFYDEVLPIEMFDPLSQFLGAVPTGLISYSYYDCVKFAGHSCPTVASTFLMARAGLQKLYPNDTPVRGNIIVSMRSAKDEGVTGVIANVLSFITGASDESGFKGLAGKYQRADLLSFNNSSIEGIFELRRIDNDKNVILNFLPTKLPMSNELKVDLNLLQTGKIKELDVVSFGERWQQRVIELLTHFDKYIEIK